MSNSEESQHKRIKSEVLVSVSPIRTRSKTRGKLPFPPNRDPVSLELPPQHQSILVSTLKSLKGWLFSPSSASSEREPGPSGPSVLHTPSTPNSPTAKQVQAEKPGPSVPQTPTTSKLIFADKLPGKGSEDPLGDHEKFLNPNINLTSLVPPLRKRQRKLTLGPQPPTAPTIWDNPPEYSTLPKLSKDFSQIQNNQFNTRLPILPETTKTVKFKAGKIVPKLLERIEEDILVNLEEDVSPPETEPHPSAPPLSKISIEELLDQPVPTASPVLIPTQTTSTLGTSSNSTPKSTSGPKSKEKIAFTSKIFKKSPWTWTNSPIRNFKAEIKQESPSSWFIPVTPVEEKVSKKVLVRTPPSSTTTPLQRTPSPPPRPSRKRQRTPVTTPRNLTPPPRNLTPPPRNLTPPPRTPSPPLIIIPVPPPLPPSPPPWIPKFRKIRRTIAIPGNMANPTHYLPPFSQIDVQFDGTKTIKEFLQKYELLAISYGWTEADKLRFFPNILEMAQSPGTICTGMPKLKHLIPPKHT